MNEQQAFNIIVQALEAANAGKRFSLKDSATIFSAVGVLAERYQPEEMEKVEELPEGDPEPRELHDVKAEEK